MGVDVTGGPYVEKDGMSYTSPDKPARKTDDEKLLDRARRCFKLVCDAEAKQRLREREDLAFQLPENQWPDAARRERAGDATTPGRPMLSISLLKQPMQLVYNQFAKARLGVNLHPVSETADKELAEVKQGLYRRIERDGGADPARGWAFMRALTAGRGWYRVVTRYDEDADPESDGAWDQEIAFQRILHQESVYMDPSAQEADFSDAKYAFVTAYKTEDEFKREFPKAKLSRAGEALDWEGMEAEAPEWVRNASAEGERAILVAEYWYKDITREEITDPNDKERKRSREVVTVHCCKIAGGGEVLEKQEWNGRYIPLVPVIGEELQPIGGDRMWQGMIRPARDGQMLYNYAASTLVERMALEPKTPFIGYAESFEGYDAEWAQANTRNLPYIRANLKTDASGRALPLPQRAQIDGSGMSLALMALQEGKNFVQASTAVFEPSLGEMPSGRDGQSGRAILALQQQTDAGTSHYIQNLVQITLQCEARIVLDLMPHIYDRPGRVTAVVTGEDENEVVMLGAPFAPDPRTGAPVQAQPGQRGAKTYDLSKGKFGVSVDIGKSHQTRMEAGQQFMTEVIGAVPQIMDIAGDLFFKFRDEPGAPEIAERLRKTIAGKYPGLLDEKGIQAPEAAQAELQGLKQQMQMMGMEMQAMGKAIETEQVKAEARLMETRMKIESEERIAAANNETKLAIEGMAQRLEALIALQKASHETAAQHEQMAHEVGLAAAGGQTMTLSQNRGQDSEQEEGREMSQGDGREMSEEEQPPMMGAE